jgi:hypothetical protein
MTENLADQPEPATRRADAALHRGLNRSFQQSFPIVTEYLDPLSII